MWFISFYVIYFLYKKCKLYINTVVCDFLLMSYWLFSHDLYSYVISFGRKWFVHVDHVVYHVLHMISRVCLHSCVVFMHITCPQSHMTPISMVPMCILLSCVCVVLCSRPRSCCGKTTGKKFWTKNKVWSAADFQSSCSAEQTFGPSHAFTFTYSSKWPPVQLHNPGSIVDLA